MNIKLDIITIAPIFVLKATRAYLSKIHKDTPKNERDLRVFVSTLNKLINTEIIEREIKKCFR